MCCKPRRSTTETRPATGPTSRLDDAAIEGAQYTTSVARSGWPAHFPWWTLWLIWPLLGLAKAIAPAVIAAAATLSQWTVPALPLLLIVIGVALLMRRRDR